MHARRHVDILHPVQGLFVMDLPDEIPAGKRVFQRRAFQPDGPWIKQ